MSETHFRGRIVQKALIVKEGKVLITRDSRDKVFELPGGRLDEGEQPKEGLSREIREELGVETKIDSILDIKNVYHGRDEENMVAVYYILSLINREQEFVSDPVEVEEMQWVDSESYTKYEYFPEYKDALEFYFSQKI